MRAQPDGQVGLGRSPEPAALCAPECPPAAEGGAHLAFGRSLSGSLVGGPHGPSPQPRPQDLGRAGGRAGLALWALFPRPSQEGAEASDGHQSLR